MNGKPKLILADDHRMVLEGLAGLLGQEFEVVATADDGEGLLELVAQRRPDAVLFDLMMPGMPGLAALRLLAPRYPAIRFIAVTMHTDLGYVREAFMLGAHGYVFKGASPAALIAAVWTVVRGGRYVSPELGIDAEALHGDPGPATRDGSGLLTARQREVVRRVAAGLPGKQIASELGISLKTVEFHRASIARQLGLKSTAALTRYALAHGLVADNDARSSLEGRG